MDVSAALYYTLSTISQTLAGALGLFAAFMIIRINSFNQMIYERMSELHGELGYADQGLGRLACAAPRRRLRVLSRHHERVRLTAAERLQEMRLSEGLRSEARDTHYACPSPPSSKVKCRLGGRGDPTGIELRRRDSRWFHEHARGRREPVAEHRVGRS